MIRGRRCVVPAKAGTFAFGKGVVVGTQGGFAPLDPPQDWAPAFAGATKVGG